MSEFTLHTPDTAPEEAKPLMDNSVKAFGMLPNLHAVMAESPQLLEGYQRLTGLFQATSLSKAEQHVVWLTINVAHNCHYCVPAHTMLANMDGVAPEVVEALRNETTIPDEKLEALRTFTLKMVEKRGAVSKEDRDAFYAAGFTQRHVLDVVVGMAHKVMSNYVNHFAETPVDAPFAQFKWEKQSA